MAEPCSPQQMISTTSSMNTGRKKKTSMPKYRYPIPQKSFRRKTPLPDTERLPYISDPPSFPTGLNPMSSTGWNPTQTANTVSAEQISEYHRVLKLLVRTIYSFKEREEASKRGDRRQPHGRDTLVALPLAMRAEVLRSELAHKERHLHRIRRITDVRSKCSDEFLKEGPSVEKLRHSVRQWVFLIQDSRRRKIILWVDKENKHLRRTHTELQVKQQRLLKDRQDNKSKLRCQTREKLKWKNAEYDTRKHMHALESAFEFVADGAQSHKLSGARSMPTLPSVRVKNRTGHHFQAHQAIQMVKAMKVAVTQTSRANRELEAMIGFDKALRKKLIGKLQNLLNSVAYKRHTSSHASKGKQSYHAAWSGPKAGDFVQYKASSHAQYYPDADVGTEFLKRACASAGRFPHLFISDLPYGKDMNVLNFLGREFVSLVYRTRGLERVFQGLQEIRMFDLVEKAVAYIVDLLCCCLHCERVSYWIIDNERGIAWTKSAAGGKEICIPVTTGFVGATVQSKSIMHVKDAYSDPRFNPASDLASGFRTKNVLCAPILQSKQPPTDGAKRKTINLAHFENVVAVVQAVNKKSEDGTGKFDDTDIFMLSTLGYGMTDVVLNCEQKELNSRTILRKNIFLSFTWELSLNCRGPADLIRIIKTYLGKMFQGIDATLTLAYHDHVERLDVRNQEVVLVSVPFGVGVTGLCVDRRSRVHVRDLSLEPRYDPAIDIAIDEDSRGEYSLHCLPLKRGALLSAVVQWVCKQRPRVDFGDDGLFNEANPRHIDLSSRMMTNVLGLVEQWYPLMDRLQQ